MKESKALMSLDSYEAAVDKKVRQNEEQRQELQALICELVRENVPYRYLTAVSTVLSRLEADGRELHLLSVELWYRSTDEFLKWSRSAG